MAKTETITLAGLRSRGVNIQFPVGAVKGNAGNGAADVMLIQTMFHYLARMQGRIPMKNIGFSPAALPKITGVGDGQTKSAILRFQRHNADELLSVDGLIEPASYDGRNIKPGQRYMTITWMHFLVQDMELHNNEPYIDGLVRITPDLRTWLS